MPFDIFGLSTEVDEGAIEIVKKRSVFNRKIIAKKFFRPLRYLARFLHSYSFFISFANMPLLLPLSLPKIDTQVASSDAVLTHAVEHLHHHAVVLQDDIISVEVALESSSSLLD